MSCMTLELVSALRELDRPMRACEVAAMVGISPLQASHLLRSAISTGWPVTRLRWGVYRWTPC
jgi:hypothetical protein